MEWRLTLGAAVALRGQMTVLSICFVWISADTKLNYQNWWQRLPSWQEANRLQCQCACVAAGNLLRSWDIPGKLPAGQASAPCFWTCPALWGLAGQVWFQVEGQWGARYWLPCTGFCLCFAAPAEHSHQGLLEPSLIPAKAQKTYLKVQCVIREVI